MSGVITTIGVIIFKDVKTNERTGCVDICRDETGNVHMRVHRHGDEVVAVFSRGHAKEIAALLNEAAS